MADNRDLNHKPTSFETEDDSGLELSLGLSCGRSINKAKGKDSVQELNSHEGKKREKNGKTCLDTAPLKHFLQRTIGEEDNGKQQAGSLPQQHENFWTSLETTTSREPEKLVKMHMNEVQFPGFGEVCCAAKNSELPNASLQHILSNAEKNAHAESPGTPANKSTIDAMPRDIQISPHIAAGQFTQHNLPAHFLDTFRNGSAVAGPAIVQSCVNTSLMQNPFQIVGTQSPSLGLRPSFHLDTTQGKQFTGTENVNADQQHRQPVVQQDWQEDVLEEQKKRDVTTQKGQEARKKRKQLIEEQKQQKKAKKEDERAGLHGFRRPGSNTWDPGSNTWDRGWELSTPSVADMEMSKTYQDIHEEGNRMHEIACSFQRGRDRNTEDNEQETDEESSGSQEEQSDISDNAFLPSVNVDKLGKSLSASKEGGKFPNSSKDPTEVGQYMTARINGLLKAEEKEQDCRMLTSVSLGKPPIHCTPSGNNSNTALANLPTTTTIAMTSAALPYSVPPFPVMPAPYSLPTSVPSHPNVPFPVGYPFVYLMQYPPPAVDGSNCTAARPPIYHNGFQLPLGYAPFQLPTLEASPPWVPVLRPQQSPSFSPPNFEGARTSSEPKEGEAKVSQERSTIVLKLGHTCNNFHRCKFGSVLKLECNAQLLEIGTAEFEEGVKSYDKQKSQVSLSTDDTSEQTNSSLSRSDASHNFQDQCAEPDLQVMSAHSTTPGTSLCPLQMQSGTGKMQIFTVHDNTTGPATHKTIKKDLVNSPGNDEMKLETRDLNYSNVGETGMAHQTIRKDGSGQVVVGSNMTNAFPQEVWNLRPGIACGMRFGGSGATPDLPWVSTSGAGPNSKTICGVLYRYNASQVRIVCACHGRHMSPSEFVLHADIAEASSPENIVANPHVIGSEAASAQG